MGEQDKKQCPICHKYTEDYEMYCDCGYEFGSNRCTNPECRSFCGDNIGFCPDCGFETENYMNGYIAGIPTNIS